MTPRSPRAYTGHVSDERDTESTGKRVKRVPIDEFRADASEAFREVRERGIVTIVERDGRPRMHILRQVDPLDE